MKRIAYIFGVFALITASAISCEKEAQVENTENAGQGKQEQLKPETPTLKTLTFKITDGNETKMLLSETDGKKHGAWEEDDYIGFVANNGTVEPAVPNDSGEVQVENYNSSPNFTVTPTHGLTAGNKICFWYPYRSNQTNPSSVQLVIPAAQTQDGSNFDFDAMPMVAEPLTVTSEMASAGKYEGKIQFANLGSVICFKVFSSNDTYAAEKVTSVTFTESAYAIAGHFNFNLAGVDFSNETTLACSGYSAKSVTTTLSTPASIGADKEHAADVYMVVAPGTYSGTVVVATDAAFYTYTLTSKEFTRSGLKSFGLNLGKTPSVRTLKYAHTWDLSQVSYSSASSSSVQWAYGLINMTATKVGSGTAANNWLPPVKTESKFYTGNTLSFSAPTLQIEKVEYTAKDNTNATTMANCTWTNANASSDESLATIIPIDGSASFSATTGLIEGTKMKVYFDNTDYSIGKTAVEHGSFTVKKGEDEVSSAKVNTTITLTATPESGYSLTGWTVTDANSNPVTVVGNTFQMPASNVTVSASFTDDTYCISIPTTLHGTVTTTPADNAASGASVSISIVPNDGYVLASLSVKDSNNDDVSVSNNQFTMPSSSVTISASFARVYSIEFNTTTNQSSVNNYASSFNTISDGITVTCINFNNNNTSGGKGSWTYIQAGAAKANKDDGDKITTGTITTADAISESIEKVVVSVEKLRGSATAILRVASNSIFTENVETVNYGAIATGNLVFSINAPAANRYYRLEFECTNTTLTNGVVKVTGIQYSTID